jgi:transcriptional regulator with XRE-family HTH domain
MDSTAARQRTTGLDLKLARVALGVPQREIARQLGVSPQRVSGIEATYRPTHRICARYLAALDAIAPPGPGSPLAARSGARP